MVTISNFILQYRNTSFAAMQSSPYDLIITEGAPLPRAGSVPELSDSEVAALQAQGRIVAGTAATSTNATHVYTIANLGGGLSLSAWASHVH